MGLQEPNCETDQAILAWSAFLFPSGRYWFVWLGNLYICLRFSHKVFYEESNLDAMSTINRKLQIVHTVKLHCKSLTCAGVILSLSILIALVNPSSSAAAPNSEAK